MSESNLDFLGPAGPGKSDDGPLAFSAPGLFVTVDVAQDELPVRYEDPAVKDSSPPRLERGDDEPA